MFFNYVIVFACALLVSSKSLPENNTAIISTYAKVAHWGSVSTTEKPISQGRSHSGQTLWTHRSDVNIIGGQNLKTAKPKVVYQYAEKVAQKKNEAVPGVGEVQERFNPRPYFDYTHVPPKQNGKGEKSKTKADDSAPAAPPTFDSFPVFNGPAPSSPDLYSSQYSSYNPPSSGPVGPSDDSAAGADYPPNAPLPSDDTNGGYQYNPPQDAPAAPEAPRAPAPVYPTLGPPLAPTDQVYYPSAGNHYPEPSKEQVYYPPSDDAHETILDHPPPGWDDSKDIGGAPDMGAAPDMKPQAINGNGHDMAEHDLSPPPSPDFNGQFPQYLYNGQGHNFDYDFDHHHVYKEVTTTEAPEDERVNKGHYSYYYLGRKLWYVPLYFSVYFIIYVTVLILKSIARHKVQFKHQYLHKDMAKDMPKDMEHGRSLNLDELHENVTSAIDTSRRKFTYVAM